MGRGGGGSVKFFILCSALHCNSLVHSLFHVVWSLKSQTEGEREIAVKWKTVLQDGGGAAQANPRD